MSRRRTSPARFSAPVLALLAAACGASGRDDNTAVDLLFGHEAGRAVAAEASSRGFTDSAGRAVVLTRGIAAVQSVELFPCTPGGASRLLRLLSPVGVAHAHGVGTERRLAVPHLVDVLEPDGAPALAGTVKPLPGRYCRAHVVFGPADADTEGAAAKGMVGRTLDLVATLDSGSGPVPIHLQSDAVVGVDVALELPLSRDEHAAQTFTLRYGGWLDGIDPTAPDAAAQVLSRISAQTLSSQ